MLRLLRLAIKMISSIPAPPLLQQYIATLVYQRVEQLFRYTLLAGSTRVPSPATGNTALRMRIKSSSNKGMYYQLQGWGHEYFQPAR